MKYEAYEKPEHAIGVAQIYETKDRIYITAYLSLGNGNEWKCVWFWKRGNALMGGGIKTISKKKLLAMGYKGTLRP